MAIRRGRTLAFSSGRRLTACPALRARGVGDCQAACVPITFMGSPLGVVHALAPSGAPLAGAVVARLEILAGAAASRIGGVRSLNQVQVQASTDPLTGLPNRRALEAAVRSLRERGQGAAVAIADLDHFKRLNDTYGHEAGDRALRTFAKVVRDCLRSEDLAARYGGEEFVLVLPGVSARDGAAALDRIRERLAAATSHGDGPRFTTSFGIAEAHPGDPFDEVLALADAALLQAKSRGRDQVVVAGARDAGESAPPELPATEIAPGSDPGLGASASSANDPPAGRLAAGGGGGAP